MSSPEIDLDRVLFGSDHNSIDEAMLADLLSALPLVGMIGDFFRSVDAKTQRQKILQMLDMLSEPLPFINILTPTNTLLFLDKTGKIDLDFLDELIKSAKMLKR